MKKIFFIFCITILFSLASYSQCNYTLYPSYIKITSTQSIIAANTWYWVCENVVLTIDSSAAGTFFLEQNSTIKFAKASLSCDVVYAKNGCTIINNSAGCIGIGANPGNVTIINTGSGSANITLNCPTMIYNYANVGGSACVGTPTGILENKFINEEDLIIYPNPVSKGSSSVSIENIKGIKKIQIIDLNGKKISEQNNSFIDLNNVPPGFYFLHVQSESRDYIKKLIVLD